LHTNIFSEQLSQTLQALEQTIDNLSFVINQNNFKALEKKFETTLGQNSYIRSINIIENGLIIHSSNPNNKGLKVDFSSYYPTPMFDKTILRFGTLHHGRDISQADPLLHYLPIIKQIETSTQKTYQILMILNLDEFHNRYLSDMANNLEILRIDGKLLYTTNQKYTNTSVLETPLYKEAIEKTLSFGVETIQNQKYLSAYQLTPTYPIMISVKSDYKKTLEEWEEKRFYILLIVTAIVMVFILLAITLIAKHDRSRKEEIRYQKEKLENKKKFEIIFEQQNFLASILNKDGTINQINHIFAEFLKEEDTTIIGKKLYELSCWDEEDKNWIIFNLENYIQSQNTKKELKVTDKNNDIHYIELLITSVEYEDNFNLVVIGTDITQDKLKEEKLQNAYTVFDNTNDGILITDKNTKIIDVNNAFTINTGYTIEDVIGKRVYSSKTINNLLNDLSAIINHAILKGKFKGENPLKPIKRQKIRNERQRYFSADEIKLLLEEVQKLRDGEMLTIFILLSLSTGGRVKTICNIKVQDFDMVNGIVSLFDFKNQSSYKGFISSDIITKCKEWIQQQHYTKLDYIISTDGKRVFSDENGNEDIKYILNRLSPLFNKLFNQGLKAGDSIDRAVPHTLRHTFASQLAINGTSIYTIQKLMNHKDISQTLRYAKLAPDTGKLAVIEMTKSLFSDT